jgi:predicted amidohydrolase
VYFVAADRWGVERGVDFSGGSCVIGPDGEMQAYEKTGDCIVYGEVDIAKARDKSWFPESVENKMLDRRPDAYHNLTLNTYVANPLRVHRLYDHDPLPAGRKSRVAVVQFAPAPGDIEANLARIEALVGGYNEEADLFVLPELAVTGVKPFSREEAEALAQPVPGRAVERLQAVARARGCYLVAGLIERDAGALFNAAVLAGPEGIVGSYRKLHLDATDRGWATAGEEFRAFNIPAGRIGLLIGYDALFPESARCLAVEGCDVIAVAAALRGPVPEALGDWTDFWNIWRMRSGENNTYLAVANQYGAHDGLEFMGGSGIFGPDGEPGSFGSPVSAVAPESGDAVAGLEISTLDAVEGVPTNPVRRKELVQQRRTEYFALGHMPNPPVLELLQAE